MKNNKGVEPYVAPEMTVIKVVTNSVIAGSDQIDPINPGEGGEE